MKIEIGGIEINLNHQPRIILTIIRSAFWGIIFFSLYYNIIFITIVAIVACILVPFLLIQKRDLKEYIKSITSTIFFPIIVFASYIYYCCKIAIFVYSSYAISLLLIYFYPDSMLGAVLQFNLFFALFVVILRNVYFTVDPDKSMVDKLYLKSENIITFIGERMIVSAEENETENNELLKDFLFRLFKPLLIFTVVKYVASPRVLYLSVLSNWFILVIITILSFSISYRALSFINPSDLNVGTPITLFDSFYFSVTTIFGGGETNITPQSIAAKILVILEIVCQILILVILFSILTTNIEHRIRISSEQIDTKEKELQDSFMKEMQELIDEVKILKRNNTKENE